MLKIEIVGIRTIDISPIYSHIVLTSAKGQTPYDYVIKTRIRRAKDIHSTSNDSFAYIAQKSGFKCHSLI